MGAAVLAESGSILKDGNWLMQQRKEKCVCKLLRRKESSLKPSRSENEETGLLAEQNPAVADHNQVRSQRSRD